MAKMEAQAKSIENEAASRPRRRAAGRAGAAALRAELEKLRLECDVVLPAEAAAHGGRGPGAAASGAPVENGKAAAEALRAGGRRVEGGRAGGRDVYLLQQLRSFVEPRSGRVAPTEVASSRSWTAATARPTRRSCQLPGAVPRVMAETARAVGVDVARCSGGGRPAR
jgi:flotillin